MHEPSLNQLNIRCKKKRSNIEDDNNEKMKENQTSNQPKKQYQNSGKQKMKRNFIKQFVDEPKTGRNKE